MAIKPFGFKYSIVPPYREIEALKAKRTRRFEINGRAIAILQDSNSHDVHYDKCFKFQYGGPKLDEHFQQLFEKFFVFIRGKEALVQEGAYKIISTVSSFGDSRYNTMQPFFPDVYWDAKRGSYVESRIPTYALKKRLETIVDKNCGLFSDFLMLLKQENRGFNGQIFLGNKVSYHEENYVDIAFAFFRGISFVFTLSASELLYPKVGDRIKEIYSRLLAIKWLEQDQQRLAGDLRLEFIPRQVPMFLPEYYFSFDGTRYVTYPTLGDGACALHALLGEKVNGQYRYRGSVRKAFTDALREQRQDPHIQQLFLDILRSYIDNVEKDASSKMLFSNITDTWPYEYIVLKRDSAKRLDTLKKQEAELWIEKLEDETFKEKFLETRRNDRLRGGKAPETPEEVLEKLRQDSLSILNTVRGEENQFIPLLGGAGQRKLFRLRHTKELIENREIEEGDKILLSDKAFNHYVQIVQQEAFWFNAQEIELASHLFNKKTLLFSVVQEGEERHLASQSFNPDLDGETIHILHRPGHFCRVAPSDELTLLDMIRSYAKSQHEAEAEIERDLATLDLLKSTAKQEICQLGFSGGVSLFSANFLPIAFQAVKSATNLTLTYLDPYRDSQISRGAEALALPVFKYAIGGPLKTIVVSFVVDQGVRQFFEMEKEKNGVEAPEWVKRLVISPISAIADKDPATKIVSGLFGVAIKGGMDGALHKWEEYYEIEPEYWVQNPSWGCCIIKAGFTTESFQEAMANGLMKAIEKDGPKEETPPEIIDRSHLLSQPPKNVNMTYQIEEGKGFYYINLVRQDFETKQVGKVPDQEKAQKICNYMNSLVSQINTLNTQSYELQCLYERLGLSPNEMPATLLFEQLYFDIDAAGKKSKVGLNGNNKFNGEGFKSSYEYLHDKAEEILSAYRTQLANYKANLKAKAPAYIQQPKNNVEAPIVQEDEKYYNVSYTDQNGRQVSLGKYKTAEDAQLISNGWSTFQLHLCEWRSQCYEAQTQLVEQGVDIASIPDRPHFEMPQLSGTNSEKNYTAIQGSRIRNEKTFQSYLKNLQQLSKEPIITTPMTYDERREFLSAITSNIKEPKEHGFWFNAWRAPGKAIESFNQWCNDHGVQIGVNISTSVPLYSAPKSSGSTYHETQMDLAYQGGTPDILAQNGSDTASQPTASPPDLPSLTPTTPQSPTTNSNWTWPDHQAYTQYQLMQTLESSRTERSHQPTPHQPLDLTNPTQVLELAYRDLWGQGYLPSPSSNDTSLHLPVMQTASLIQSMGLSSIFFTSQEDSQNLMMVVDNDFVKSIPKGIGRVALGALKLMVPDMSDVPNAENPHDHLNRVGYSLGKRYDALVQIEDPNSLLAKAGTLTGELSAFGPIGKVIRIAELPGVFCAIAEGGTIGAIFAEANNQNPLEGAFIGGALGGGAHKLVGLLHFPKLTPSPLSDRALQIHPGKYSNELQFLERLNRPAFRGGVASEGRVINALKPINRSNNCSYVTFVEHGQTKAVSIGDLSYAGTLPDKGPWSKAGRALQKHSERINPTLPKPKGNPLEVNLQGQKILGEILNHPDKIVIKDFKPRFGDIIDVRVPGKSGARFTSDGKEMICFLEP